MSYVWYCLNNCICLCVLSVFLAIHPTHVSELADTATRAPFGNPRENSYSSDLKPWVLDEAVAAYTSTGPSLQAALDIYKRNVFLAVSLTVPSSSQMLAQGLGSSQMQLGH